MKIQVSENTINAIKRGTYSAADHKIIANFVYRFNRAMKKGKD